MSREHEFTLELRERCDSFGVRTDGWRERQRLKRRVENAEVVCDEIAIGSRGHVALQSNLKDFALTDVFRLLGNGQKSGTLYLERPPAEGKVRFDDGRIFFASSNWNRESLGQRLVKARVIAVCTRRTT